MPTARTLCTNALRTGGCVAGVQVPTADEIDLALRELNGMIAGWSLESWYPPSTAMLDFTVPASSLTMKIGDFLAPARKDGTNSYRLDNRQYLNLIQRSEGNSVGDACAFAYQRVAAGHGVITFDRAPAGSWDCRIYYNVVIPSYELDDEITLPPAYLACIEYGLAALLSTHFGSQSDRVDQIAAQRLERIRMNNIKVPRINSDYNGSGVYDIYTDRYL